MWGICFLFMKLTGQFSCRGEYVAFATKSVIKAKIINRIGNGVYDHNSIK